MAANASGTMTDQRMVDGAIPTKRAREQPEEKFEYVVEKDMVSDPYHLTCSSLWPTFYNK